MGWLYTRAFTSFADPRPTGLSCEPCNVISAERLPVAGYCSRAICCNCASDICFTDNVAAIGFDGSYDQFRRPTFTLKDACPCCALINEPFCSASSDALACTPTRRLRHWLP